EPKKKKLTLQQIRALETKNDEEVAKKIQSEWDAEEERKRLEAMKKFGCDWFHVILRHVWINRVGHSLLVI
ncbi:hypothetical protein Tco_0612050, partial [Tanacetum coccineum]